MPTLSRFANVAVARLCPIEVLVGPARVIELLSTNASILEEDVKHLEEGTFKFQAFGVDVTNEQAARLKANLLRLEQAIEALRNPPRSPKLVPRR
jgi:hypothetical protein